MMTDKSLNRQVTMPFIITFVFLCPVIICGLVFGSLVIDIPWPPPPVISLTYLPLPHVAITPDPAITSNWNTEEDQFSRSLNSQIELYTNRFGMQWMTDEGFRLHIRIPVNRDSLSSESAEISELSNYYISHVNQGGNINSRFWNYRIVLPWPIEPFAGEFIIPIDGTIPVNREPRLADNAIGPAAAEFIEQNPDPSTQSDDVPLARCRHHVHGQITLTSISPVVGNFQFACQFDATEYALVSGWFWE